MWKPFWKSFKIFLKGKILKNCLLLLEVKYFKSKIQAPQKARNYIEAIIMKIFWRYTCNLRINYILVMIMRCAIFPIVKLCQHFAKIIFLLSNNFTGNTLLKAKYFNFTCLLCNRWKQTSNLEQKVGHADNFQISCDVSLITCNAWNKLSPVI